MKYKIGNTIFEAANLVEAISFVKENSLSGKMVKVSDDTKANISAPTSHDRTVTVTCVVWTQEDGSWVRKDHKWTGTVQEVSGQRCCPQHRR